MNAGEKREKRLRPSKNGKREAAAKLVAGGERVATAARVVGTDKNDLGEWLRTECGQAALDRYAQEHAAAMTPTIDIGRELLRAGAFASVRALLEEVRAGKGLVRVRAAEAILDRVGLPRVQKVEGTLAPAFDLSKLTDEELDRLTEIAAKAGGA